MRSVLLAASAVLACRLLIALAIIPPWQHPDENSHVAHVELRRTNILHPEDDLDPSRQAEILTSMASYDWWQHRDANFPPPAVMPPDFVAAGPRVGTPPIEDRMPPTYFLVLGRVLSWFPDATVVEHLYFLRTVSALTGVLTLWVAWLGARASLGTTGGLVVTALLALHPQFAVISAAAIPDALVNLLAACMWWQTAVAIRGERVVRPLALAWIAALAAVSADRMAVPLLGLAAVASLVVVGTVARRRERGRRQALGLASLLVTGTVVGLGVLLTFGQTYGRLRIWAERWTPVPEARNWAFFSEFTSFLHESWWLSLGWVRYGPPDWWVTITTALTTVAAAGVIWRIAAGRRDDSRIRALLVVAGAGLAIQIAAVYWVYFRLANGPQGKSLFPVLVPTLILLWTGIEAWVPAAYRRHAAIALVLLLAVLDAAAWYLVALPAYYASL